MVLDNESRPGSHGGIPSKNLGLSWDTAGAKGVLGSMPYVRRQDIGPTGVDVEREGIGIYMVLGGGIEPP